MLNEYPQEFVDSVMKTSRSSRPYSDKIYQETLIPYVKVTSEKFRRIENRFNVRSIFKTKHTLRGTLMKIGPVRDAQQTKQYVYNIPWDCGRCYMAKRQAMKAERRDESPYVLLGPFDIFIPEGNILNINRVGVWVVHIIVLDVLVKRKVLTPRANNRIYTVQSLD
jgi:hypothetical protein